MNSGNRDYAIESISNLRRLSGRVLFDVGQVLAMPTRDLQRYLAAKIHDPLSRELVNAAREGYEWVSYALYSAYDRDKEQIALSVREDEPIPNGRMPEEIEAGINLTKENHITKPRPVEFILYVKAIEKEPLTIPDHILEDHLSLA